MYGNWRSQKAENEKLEWASESVTVGSTRDLNLDVPYKEYSTVKFQTFLDFNSVENSGF